VADRDGHLATGECLSTTTRELAQRLSGADEVLLLWHPESDRVELSLRNLATGVVCEIEIAPADAIDAFYHPFAYAARRGRPCRVDQEETAIVDV
jgi:hypothetical protein